MLDPSTVLLAGFEPFGGRAENVSRLAARSLDGRRIEGKTVASIELPVRFGDATEALSEAFRRHRPELTICVGESSRPEISLERIAINVDDARIADNAGAQPTDRPIAPHGPAAYWSTLPIKAITAAIVAKGIAASVSESAGTFVCNHVFYGLMRMLVGTEARGGFIHVPAESSNVSLEQIVVALEIAIETTLRSPRAPTPPRR